MTPARLHTVEEIFHSALDQQPEERASFLEAACEGDDELRVEIETLLASHRHAVDFIETPVAGIATRLFENAPPDLLVGQQIAHYELTQRIGAGGMGEVYLATDISAGRKAALKLLPLRFTGDPARLKRFEQEARALVALNHPNILTIYEIGEDRSTHYIASELIDGETLRQRLERRPMEMEEAIDVAIQVASALVAAHDAGIVHRDIKPENIMLRTDGYVKVLDFGIAKLAEQEVPVTMAEEEPVLLAETRLGSIFGTARYMSPEQARGAVVDQRTDIWSLGAVLYEMVAGRAPFEGESPGEVLTLILEMEPPPLTNDHAQIPGELQQIIGRMLRKETKERYQSARELLDALKGVRRRMDLSIESKRLAAAPAELHWSRSPAAIVLAVLVVALAVTLPFYWYRNEPISAPEKSIAVLPFENLSDNKDNSYFASGIQEDVLTSLAQIRELKVISRTSVMAYQKPNGHDMRAIGRALGVANILEGSVRQAGNRVFVNVQLIDARNDRHLWAERYDRTVADSIGLQGELATQIAVALKATLAPEEKARLRVEPTANSAAYVLYLTALGKEKEDEMAAERLYVQAAAIDPGFALAYARASVMNSRLAGPGLYPERRAKARAQAEEALRLAPTLGEAHMALGVCLYWGNKNYDAALKEFELAAAILPNSAEVYSYIAGIYRRQGRWRESLATFQRAEDLDPRNSTIVFQAANNHVFVRDWPGARAGYNRNLKIATDAAFSRIALAYLEVFQNGNPAAGSKMLAGAGSHPLVALTRWDFARLDRDYVAAERILSAIPDGEFFENQGYPKTFYQGQTALARGDIELAQRYFAAATPVMEEWTRRNSDDPWRHSLLGLLYAYSQRKEDAVREARHAVEMEPEGQDAFHASSAEANLALVYALVGEQDQAITLIEHLLSIPGLSETLPSPSNITLAELRLRGEWDSLRSNPRFQKILAGPEPKTIF